MEDRFIDVDGLQLHYIEKNEAALKTIFFIHGNSMSSRTWRKQWNDPLFNEYRLVALDLPAHGRSAVADAQTVYNLPALGRLMVNAVRLLSNNKPYILTGVSLGTNIMVEMLPSGIMPLGMVLAGPCIVGEGAPLTKMLKPDTHVSVVFTDEPDAEEVKLYGLETSHSTPEDLQIFLEDFNEVKQPFRSALSQSISDQNYSDEIQLLKQYQLPVLIVFGKDEKAVNADYLNNVDLNVWNDRIVLIKGASHLVHIDRSPAFNEVFSSYVGDVFTKAGF